MTLLSVLEQQIYSPVIVDSSRAMSLRRFAWLALEWQLPEAQVRQGLNYFGLGEMEGRIFPVMGGAATPVVMADAVTPLNAANLNKYVNAEGKANVKVRYAVVQWDAGIVFLVNGGIDSAGIVNGDLVWNAPILNALNITISGYTGPPAVFVSTSLPVGHRATGASTGAIETNIRFFNFSGVLQTVPDANFGATLLVLGQ